jgi:esterase/lipase superfamily enzyme
MGAQALLEVLRDIRNIGGPAVAAKPMFNEVILAAPDVTRDNFEQIVRQVRGLTGGMTLYASANDRALRLSQKLSGASAGHVPANGPVVVAGVDSIDVSAASTDFFSLNHSTFADRAQLIEDMRRLLDKSQRPPDQRIEVYKPVTGASGTYWKYEKRE